MYATSSPMGVDLTIVELTSSCWSWWLSWDFFFVEEVVGGFSWKGFPPFEFSIFLARRVCSI